MAYTLGEIMGEVLKLANRTDSEKQTVVKQAVNRRYRQILRHYAWPELINETTISVSAATAGLAANVDKVLKLYDRSNDRVILPLQDTDLVERYINEIGSTGTICYYSRLGTRGVHTQPGAASTLTSTSTSSGDVGVCTIRVKGYNAGIMHEDEILVGATTASSYDTVVSFSKSSSAGTVTLSSTESTPITMGSIGPAETVSRYPIIRLHPAPSSATTLYLVYQLKIDDLVDDEDTVILPCEDLLVVGGFSDLLRNLRQFAQAEVEEARFQMLLEDFTKDRINEDASFMFMPDLNRLQGRA